MLKKTKIIATLGPSSSDEKTLCAMIDAGVDGARFNFSHGSFSEHLKRLNTVRNAAKKCNKPVALLQDLPGPKIRVGKLPSPILVNKGDTIQITLGETDSAAPAINTTYPPIVSELHVGDTVFIDDGNIELYVEKKKEESLTCRVRQGGKILSGKGINLPQAQLKVSAFTDEDCRCLEWGIKHNFNYAALSFVREPEEVCRARTIVKRYNSGIHLIAKIEKAEAFSRIDDIIEVSNGIMIARGDLGVEMGPEFVPAVQKQIIKKCIEKDKLVITATQMLQSMIESPRPTRAEASDVANAIFDGTDCVMLSGETAVGGFPVETVKVMSKIICEAENYQLKNLRKTISHLSSEALISDALCHGAYQVACDINAKLIVVFSISGSTVMLMSKYHPPMIITGITTIKENLNRMALYHNVYPIFVSKSNYFEQMVLNAEEAILNSGLAKRGDIAVFTAGTPIGSSGTTNSLHIRRLGIETEGQEKNLGIQRKV
ncbi:MAG: pyruvate kinase [Planctomycetota bacterium]